MLVPVVIDALRRYAAARMPTRRTLVLVLQLLCGVLAAALAAAIVVLLAVLVSRLAA